MAAYQPVVQVCTAPLTNMMMMMINFALNYLFSVIFLLCNSLHIAIVKILLFHYANIDQANLLHFINLPSAPVARATDTIVK
jgi:tryptophan-rich sensory protein